jgi:hypothetical protein
LEQSERPSSAREARIYGFIARKARVAVLLRRGPSKQVRLLRWNLETDAIEPGQWLKGRIYERRCDLSPDGNLFAYFAAKHRGPVSSWTAVCRPPMLTALSFFPKDDCWGGGGLFGDDNTLNLNHYFGEGAGGHSPGKQTGKRTKTPRYMSVPVLRPWEVAGLEGVPERGNDARKPRNALNLRVLPLGEHSGRGEDSPIEDIRLARDRWTRADTGSVHTERRNPKPGECTYQLEPPAVRHKPAGDGSLRLLIRLHGIHESQGRWHVETMGITGHSGMQREFGRIDWADVDHNGEILYAVGGCVYRIAAKAGQDAITGEPKLIADLNSMVFEPVVKALIQPPAP